jgi:hypothetical protein
MTEVSIFVDSRDRHFRHFGESLWESKLISAVSDIEKTTEGRNNNIFHSSFSDFSYIEIFT